FHRALDVGEQDGDLLALAFEAGLRVQDAFREVLRCVRLGRGEARGRAGSWRQSSRMGTLRTELGRRTELTAAVHTCEHQKRGAFLTDLWSGLVLVLAPRTFHGEPSFTGFSVRLA